LVVTAAKNPSKKKKPYQKRNQTNMPSDTFKAIYPLWKATTSSTKRTQLARYLFYKYSPDVMFQDPGVNWGGSQDPGKGGSQDPGVNWGGVDDDEPPMIALGECAYRTKLDEACRAVEAVPNLRDHIRLLEWSEVADKKNEDERWYKLVVRVGPNQCAKLRVPTDCGVDRTTLQRLVLQNSGGDGGRW
jgi:hypothetical protein